MCPPEARSQIRLTPRFPAHTLEHMEVRLTPDQEAFVRQAIESGRLHRPEDAVEEALSLWEERERKRVQFLATIDLAEASLSRGEGRVITEQSMRELADEVKQRGLTRLAAEQSRR
jgi:Arc/MetJ-type ribon-helix-helix transcriptional regulator